MALHKNGDIQLDLSNHPFDQTTDTISGTTSTRSEVIPLQYRDHLGKSTSLFTSVRSAIIQTNSSPKDSIAFSRSLHESAHRPSAFLQSKVKTWKETTRCPSDQVIEIDHIKQLAKAKGNLCAIVSFRPQQIDSKIRYFLLDKVCLPGGEKAFYFCSCCPYCDCYFS